MSSHPPIFFDRDGVLNKIVMRNGVVASPRQLEEFVLEDGATAALASLQAYGLPMFALTNQPDVRRGLMEVRMMNAMHTRLMQSLPLRDVVACIHDDRDNCSCRKPKPGLLHKLREKWDLDLSRSFLVGDQERDMICGRAANCTTILLRRNYNLHAEADHIVDNLAEAAQLIQMHLASV